MVFALTLATGWVALAGTAAGLMAFLGRAQPSIEMQTPPALDLRQGIHLAVSNDRVVTDEDQAVCPNCASLVVGALDGDPCPACGTSVTELPRIRPRAVPAMRRQRPPRAI